MPGRSTMAGSLRQVGFSASAIGPEVGLDPSFWTWVSGSFKLASEYEAPDYGEFARKIIASESDALALHMLLRITGSRLGQEGASLSVEDVRVSLEQGGDGEKRAVLKFYDVLEARVRSTWGVFRMWARTLRASPRCRSKSSDRPRAAGWQESRSDEGADRRASARRCDFPMIAGGIGVTPSLPPAALKQRQPYPVPARRPNSIADLSPSDVLALQRTVGNAAIWDSSADGRNLRQVIDGRRIDDSRARDAGLAVQRYAILEPSEYALDRGARFEAQRAVDDVTSAYFVRRTLAQESEGVTETEERRLSDRAVRAGAASVQRSLTAPQVRVGGRPSDGNRRHGCRHRSQGVLRHA